jgi:hypothetical protein
VTLDPLDHDRWTAAAAAADACARVSPRFAGTRCGSRTAMGRWACVNEREGPFAGACVRAPWCVSARLGALRDGRRGKDPRARVLQTPIARANPVE